MKSDLCKCKAYIILYFLKAIVALNPNEAKTIHVYDSRDIYKLRTTTIPSHHCPGSVMFLFEKLDADVGWHWTDIL